MRRNLNRNDLKRPKRLTQSRPLRSPTGIVPVLPGGSPNHPSAPAGHAVTAGACCTILKAWFRENTVINNPVQPNRDGTALVPYTGPPLTVGGELNKLPHNMSAGRDMSGVHWRVSDDLTGLFQGEAVAIRLLTEQRPLTRNLVFG